MKKRLKTWLLCSLLLWTICGLSVGNTSYAQISEVHGHPSDVAVKECPGIPNEPDFDASLLTKETPGLLSYDIDTVAGWVTLKWAIDKNTQLVTMRVIVSMDTTKSSLSVARNPMFYIVIKNGKEQSVWIDQEGTGKCEDIKLYHGYE